MSQVYDGGDEDTGAPEEGSLDWLLEDSNRVVQGVLQQSRLDILAKFGCRELELDSGAHWVEIRFQPFRLPRLDTILFLQGVGLQSWLESIQGISAKRPKDWTLVGPFLGLAMRQLNPSGFLEGLVVAKVIKTGGLAEDELKGALLGALRGS